MGVTMRFAIAAVGCALALSSAALAQKSPPGFDEAYQEGQDQFNLGKYDEAWLLFQKARDLAPKLPGPYRWLGVTARAQENWPACIQNSIESIRLNPTSGQAKQVKDNIDACRKALGRPIFQGDIPEGQGALAVITNVEGATITVDGLKKGASPLEPIPLLTGKHKLHVDKKGYLPVDVEVEVVLDVVVDVEVALDADPDYKPEDGGIKPVEDVKIGWLVVAMNVKDATVTFDGKTVTPAADGRIELDPGIHRAEVTAPGYETWRRRVVVYRGQKRGLSISLKKTVDRTRERKMAYLGFGVAAAAGVSGFVFGWLENQAFEEAQDIHEVESERPGVFVPPPGSPEATVHTREDLDDVIARGERYGLISNISYGVALVSLGVSIYYFVKERPAEREGYDVPFAIVPVIGEGGTGGQVVWQKELDW